jgi:hypothetical protein
MSDLPEDYKWAFRVELVVDNGGDESRDPVLAELSARGAALVTKSWQKGSRLSQRAGDTRVFSESGVKLAVPSGLRV